jgi:hypothetical protein
MGEYWIRFSASIADLVGSKTCGKWLSGMASSLRISLEFICCSIDGSAVLLGVSGSVHVS